MSKNRFVISALSAALAILMILSAVSVLAATYIDEGDWRYELNPSKQDELIVAGYSGKNANVLIPPEALGKTVTAVAKYAFLNDAEITACYVPATVKELGMGAFYGCTALKKIEFYGGLDTIGNNAFYGCTALTEVVFNPQVRVSAIPKNCFNRCESLKTVVLPDSVTEIGDYAFSSCTSLTSVTIPASVTSISDKAFYLSPDVTISGTGGSYAEKYARDNNIKFVVIEQMTDTTAPVTVPATSAPVTTPATVATSAPVATSVVSTSSASTDASEVPAESSTAATSATLSTDATEASSAATGTIAPVTSAVDPSESQGTLPASAATAAPVVTIAPAVTTAPGTSAVVTTDGGNYYLIGDADLSGTINVKDATTIQKHVAGIIVLSHTAKFLANCDGLGEINVKDATMIQKYCAGFLNILFVGSKVEL